jgi:hypothetical protein
MTEAKNIFKTVIDVSLDAARIMDTDAVEADILVCENLIAVFDEMHLNIDHETAKAIWIFYSMNYHKSAWIEGGASKDTCSKAVLDMAYIFFRPEEGALKEVSEEQLAELTNQDNEVGSTVRKLLELDEDQQKFMFEYIKQLSGNE